MDRTQFCRSRSRWWMDRTLGSDPGRTWTGPIFFLSISILHYSKSFKNVGLRVCSPHHATTLSPHHYWHCDNDDKWIHKYWNNNLLPTTTTKRQLPTTTTMVATWQHGTPNHPDPLWLLKNSWHFLGYSSMFFHFSFFQFVSLSLTPFYIGITKSTTHYIARDTTTMTMLGGG